MYLPENILISLGGTCMCRVECADNICSGSGITLSSNGTYFDSG